MPAEPSDEATALTTAQLESHQRTWVAKLYPDSWLKNLWGSNVCHFTLLTSWGDLLHSSRWLIQHTLGIPVDIQNLTVESLDPVVCLCLPLLFLTKLISRVFVAVLSLLYREKQLPFSLFLSRPVLSDISLLTHVSDGCKIISHGSFMFSWVLGRLNTFSMDFYPFWFPPLWSTCVFPLPNFFLGSESFSYWLIDILYSGD